MNCILSCYVIKFQFSCWILLMIKVPPVLSTDNNLDKSVIRSFTCILFTTKVIKTQISLKQQNFKTKIYLLIKSLKVKETMPT